MCGMFGDSYLVQDILEILLDTNTETATIPESIKTLITVMDIHKNFAKLQYEDSYNTRV